MPTSDDAFSLPDSLEQKVLEALDLDEADQRQALDALYREYPEHADAIRAWLRSMDLDADGSVVLSDAGSGSTWRKLVEQLRSRGPTWTRYVFEGEIARGGMGVVHRVRDKDAHRTLALKVILGQGEVAPTGDTPPVDDRSLGRFLEEAQVASQLDHPGIVPVHEIGVDGEGRVYFTMKLVKGQDLRAVFAHVADPSDTEWTTTRALNVMLRVCEAMAYAHAKGVIHRDLKPANVMVGKFGEVYVMDWGLARVLDRKDDQASPTRDASATVDRVKSDRKARAEDTPDTPLVTMDGDVVGTPSYMPPEQAEGRLRDIGPASDVYAVGAMLYHLLAGQVPYVKPGAKVSPRSLLTTVIDYPPEPLNELRRDVTPELLAIVEKAMARDLADRYADMTTLARDLRAYLENRVVAAYETGAWAELRKWVVRNKELAVMGVAALTVAVALSTWALIERGLAADQTKAARLLADARRLAELVQEIRSPEPIRRGEASGMNQWIARAEQVAARLPLHEATLSDLRARGIALETPPPTDVAASEERLASLRECLGRHLANPPVDRLAHEILRPLRIADEKAEIAELEQALSQQRAAAAERRERLRGYDFGDDTDSRWWHEAAQDLVIGLHALKADNRFGETITKMRWRRDVAMMHLEPTNSRAADAQAWARARSAIREHPNYGGLDLELVTGLLPLGPDPESGLWEFWHFVSGKRPERDVDSGRWRMTGETGLIFVLVPGGRYLMGTQTRDPTGPNYDPASEVDERPLHEEHVAAFFLSKYEMTQGQWGRVTGSNPSWWHANHWDATTRMHPVENISWDECAETLRAFWLRIPTEAEWEYACRAGTTTVYHTGDAPASLVGFANVGDQTYGRHFGKPTSGESFDDRWGPPAPVGWLAPNLFGLHDMHGNVWEWCADRYFPRYDDERASRPEMPEDRARSRCVRGGGYNGPATAARSADRDSKSPQFPLPNLGLRPAMTLPTR